MNWPSSPPAPSPGLPTARPGPPRWRWTRARVAVKSVSATAWCRRGRRGRARARGDRHVHRRRPARRDRDFGRPRPGRRQWHRVLAVAAGPPCGQPPEVPDVVAHGRCAQRQRGPGCAAGGICGARDGVPHLRQRQLRAGDAGREAGAGGLQRAAPGREVTVAGLPRPPQVVPAAGRQTPPANPDTYMRRRPRAPLLRAVDSGE
ncbi:hypothetical protein G6F50_014444 [Rhizopus delemar]|uniref:Uncharacterized protein n=1 Tax=Rhizopus delemar TaxID=936053 RepID=A0A9P7C7W9_9FUNG|nr:hypothetical protein G6F50_014444 [Rhizopus delemar]